MEGYTTIKNRKNPIIEVTCACGCKKKWMKKIGLYQMGNMNHFFNAEHRNIYTKTKSLMSFKFKVKK